MKEDSVQEIESKVEEFIRAGKKWHYHLLTPSCSFNTHQKNALFLENPENNEVFISYSDEPEMEASKRLAQKLHGDKVFNVQDEGQEPSSEVQPIIERIKSLVVEGKAWHHHVFFPGCVFNKNKNGWMIVLEDKSRGEVLEAILNTEPKEDLRQIEALFYSQKKAK